MTDAELRPAKPGILLSVPTAQVLVAVLLVFKIYAAIVTPPIGDEAYYWMWGQKLGWSYFDHPPLHAWLLRLVDMLFGWNLFSLRALTWVTLAASFGILWFWAKRLRPDNPAEWFWPACVIYLCSPVFFLMSGLSFHDHLLIFLCLACGTAFLVFAEKWEASGRGFVWLYAAAILLGLAVLTKYNGVLLGFGAAIFFAVRKPVRPLWRSPHLYLAALLAIAIQAPVFWWNFTEGFASYRFHLSERWGGPPLRPKWNFILEYIVLTAAVVSPFVYAPIIDMFRRPIGDLFTDRARQLALSVFAASTVLLAFLSIFVEIFFYWNVVGYVLLLPLVGGWMRQRWLVIAHILYGFLGVAIYLYHFTILPIRDDWVVVSAYGWPTVAERVETYEAQYDTNFVVSTFYNNAAQLGFALHDPEVTALSSRHDQYDYWFDPTTRLGQDALIVTDPQHGTGYVSRYFDALEPLETVSTARFGHTMYEVTIYLGRNFHLSR